MIFNRNKNGSSTKMLLSGKCESSIQLFYLHERAPDAEKVYAATYAKKGESNVSVRQHQSGVCDRQEVAGRVGNSKPVKNR